jgi:hypothetical protein
MDKYVNINELQTYQIVTPMPSEKYESELFFASMAGNSTAVSYMIERVEDPYQHVCALISCAADVLIVEILLGAIQFRVFRRLNNCLSQVESLSILHYLLNHDIALFNNSHKKSEALRIATLKNDVDRVRCFLSSRTSRTCNLLAPGLNTLDKCCVELAYYNENDEILKLFIVSGTMYYNISFSLELQSHINTLKNEICISRIQSKRKIFHSMFIDHCRYNELNNTVLESAFPECMGNTNLQLLKAKRLIHSIHQSTPT